MAEAKQYRKKPVVIEAVQFVLGTSTKTEMLAFCPTANIGAPDNNDTDIRWFEIPTLEGDMYVSDGDWVIRGVAGEFYPCRDDIFRQTYEPAATMPRETPRADSQWCPKNLRERLCVQQHYAPDDHTRNEIGRLIALLDVHRPLGSNGKHGERRHTPTCGCEDK